MLYQQAKTMPPSTDPQAEQQRMMMKIMMVMMAFFFYKVAAGAGVTRTSPYEHLVGHYRAPVHPKPKIREISTTLSGCHQGMVGAD